VDANGISVDADAKYSHPHISVNDVSAQKLNGISGKYHRRVVKSNEIYSSAVLGRLVLVH